MHGHNYHEMYNILSNQQGRTQDFQMGGGGGGNSGNCLRPGSTALLRALEPLGF